MTNADATAATWVGTLLYQGEWPVVATATPTRGPASGGFNLTVDGSASLLYMCLHGQSQRKERERSRHHAVEEVSSTQ